MKRILAAILPALALGFTASCTTPGSAPAASAPQAAPRLVVFIVVDGLPQWQFVDYRDQLAPDGLKRFLDRGAWFSNGHYGHSFTATGPGHAVMLTGAYPHRTGIIGNDWRHPVTGQVEYCAGDTAHTYIGHKTNKLDGTSPKNLKVETVGDVLKRVNANSKVIAISSKDRGAILAGGKSGTAYMYQAQTGQFASSTYYMKEHPAWVGEFHAKKPADRYFHAEWKPLLGNAEYAKSVPDEAKWFAKGGKLPKKIGEGMDAPGPLYYGSLVPTPFSDELTLDFARAAVMGEQLGQDASADILFVSLSGHDYVNHAWGAESRLSHDHVLHLDRALQSFFKDLDAKIGKDRYVAVLTADHGFTPAPEYSTQQGRQAGRYNLRAGMTKINGELAKRFGPGQWLLGPSADTVAFNQVLARDKQVDLASLVEETRKLVMAEPPVAAAYTRSELESGSRAGSPYFEQMRKSWNRELSGDLQLVLKPYWIISSGSGSAATHGSPHPYDTHVPIAFYGPAWIKPGRNDTRVEVADIAPTLSKILGVPAPAASEGKVLPVMAGR